MATGNGNAVRTTEAYNDRASQSPEDQQEPSSVLAPKVALEAIIAKNNAEALHLMEEAARATQRAKALKLESKQVELQMRRIIASEQPTQASSAGHPPTSSIAPSVPPPPISERDLLERDIIQRARDMRRSWERRHKKNYRDQEKLLVEALDRLERHEKATGIIG